MQTKTDGGARAGIVNGRHPLRRGKYRVEGFATFMAAAYRERRFGRATYLADISAMRTRYEQVVARGNDRALVFPSWDRPSADDRTLVYQKGALVLHDLREFFAPIVGVDAKR